MAQPRAPGSASDEVRAVTAPLAKISTADGQPNLESFPSSLEYELDCKNNPTDFADKDVYGGKLAQIHLESIAELESMVEQGEYFINYIYSYRSISKAASKITSTEETKMDIAKTTYEIMGPEVDLFNNFKDYCSEAVRILTRHVNQLALPEKKRDKATPETVVEWVIRLMDVLLILDELKKTKSALNNDFSAYRRAFQSIRAKGVSVTDNAHEQVHALYMFLGTPAVILNDMKTNFAKVQNSFEVCFMFANHCLEMFEGKKYLLPTEKYAPLRVIPACLFFMDTEDTNIFKKPLVKRVMPERFLKLFKRFPAVPLFGDKTYTPFTILETLPHFDRNDKEYKMDNCLRVPEIVNAYRIANDIGQFRVNYLHYSTHFATTMNTIMDKKNRNQPLHPNDRKRVKNVVRGGLRLLSSWTCRVMEQLAFKYMSPADASSIPADIDPNNEYFAYDRCTKYNYRPEDLDALVETIGMIKSLGGQMKSFEPVLSPVLRDFVYDELQRFTAKSLGDIIQYQISQKNQSLMEMLSQLSFAVSDPLVENAVRMANAASMDKKKKKAKKTDTVLPEDLPVRTVPPSHTQLHLVRGTIFCLFSEREEAKMAKSKKDLRKEHIAELQAFYDDSYSYAYLLHFSGTLREVTDLSSLWYREFYLDLTKQVQFPIDKSIPYILTMHVFETRTLEKFEYLFCPMELYNDAAQRAISVVNRQHLFDEIEAEANLCYDELALKMADKVFYHYKQLASWIMLDKKYCQAFDAAKQSIRPPPKAKFNALFEQRHLQVVGRSFDLHHYLSQQLNNMLRENLDKVITHLEASDCTHIVELEMQLENIKLTHKLLSEWFDLDAFDLMFAEANDSLSPKSFLSRIAKHFITEVTTDLISNFVYNSASQRFVRASVIFSGIEIKEGGARVNSRMLYGSRAYAAAFDMIARMYKGFFGIEHVRASLRLIGAFMYPLLIEECTEIVHSCIVNDLTPYVDTMTEAIGQIKLPKAEYGSDGAVGYFEAKLAALVQYPDTQGVVLHAMREVGNVLAFMRLLELAEAFEDRASFIQAFPLVKEVKSGDSETEEEAEGRSRLVRILDALVQDLVAAKASRKLSFNAPALLKDLQFSARRAEKMYALIGKLSSPLLTFYRLLDEIMNSVRDQWVKFAPSNETDTYQNLATSNDFDRLWNALQFIYCMPRSDGSNPDLFGDGVVITGASLVYFLGQYGRFKVQDYCAHILNVIQLAGQPKDPRNERFVDQAKVAVDLSVSTADSIRAFIPTPMCLVRHFASSLRGAQVFTTLSLSHCNHLLSTLVSPPECAV